MAPLLAEPAPKFSLIATINGSKTCQSIVAKTYRMCNEDTGVHLRGSFIVDNRRVPYDYSVDGSVDDQCISSSPMKIKKVWPIAYFIE